MAQIFHARIGVPHVLAGLLFAGPVLGAGTLPPVPVPASGATLAAPAGAVAWSGSGAVLDDGSVAVGDLGARRVVVQRADGTVLGEILDPAALAGEDRGFGAAVAALADGRIAVFALRSPGVPPGPRIEFFAPKGAPGEWTHVGTRRLAGGPAATSITECPAWIAADPQRAAVVVAWRRSLNPALWSVCEEVAGGSWIEYPLGSLDTSGSQYLHEVAIRGGVAATVTVRPATTDLLRVAQASAESWSASVDFELGMGASGPAVTADGRVLVLTSRTDPGNIDRLFEFSRSASSGAFVFARGALLDLRNPAAGGASGIGCAGDRVHVVSVAADRSRCWVDEFGDDAASGTPRRRSFSASLPPSSSAPARWMAGVRSDALWALPSPGATTIVSGPAMLRMESFRDIDRDGTPDDAQIASGAPDCNGNGVPDAADIAVGAAIDADADGTPDACAADCDGDGIADLAAIRAGVADCDGNGIPDSPCDLAVAGTDIDGNGRLDACSGDCNGNGRLDDLDVAAGIAEDCDQDGTLDACEGYPSPSIETATAGLDTVSLWQRTEPSVGAITGLRVAGKGTFASGRRVMVIRDRGGLGDRSQVTQGDVLYFARTPVFTCPVRGDGTLDPVTVQIPAIPVGDSPAFWVVLEGVSLATPVAQLPGEGGAYGRMFFPTVVPDAAAWFRTGTLTAPTQGRYPALSVVAQQCVRPGDFDRDGAVGGRDLGALIGAWGSQDPLFDLDRNGIVAGGDLAILLSNWSSR